MNKPICDNPRLLRKRDLGHNYFSYTFAPCQAAGKCRPGQFVHIKLPTEAVFFRRAFSVASVDPAKRELEIIFKIFGRGTKLLSELPKGAEMNILGPLGSKFTMPRRNHEAVLVAGGVGFPPLMYLAEQMIRKGYEPGRIRFFYGARSKDDIIERSRMKKLGVDLTIVTEDGSIGRRGLVTEPVESFLDQHGSSVRLYSCGPEPMLKAVNDLALRRSIRGQLSLEAPMPCGYGVCLGCVVPLTDGGHARVCREGPVFEIGEVAL